MNTEIRQFGEHLAVERGLAYNTIAAYTGDLEGLHTYLTALEITWAMVTQDILEGYQAIGERDGLSRSTLARRLACFKTFFGWMRRAGAIAVDPAVDINRPQTSRRVPQALTEAEVQRLVGHPQIPARDKAILELMYSAGLRVSELTEMNLKDFNPENGTVTLRDVHGKERQVPISEEARKAVEVYLLQVRPTQRARSFQAALFLNYAGRRLSRQCVWKTVKDAAHAAGFPSTIAPGTLRHSRAVHLLETGVELTDVQRPLGHADISTTLIYTRTMRIPDGRTVAA